MRKFYTAIDIENRVKSGQKALILGPNELLTPLARDRARELGLQVRSGQTAAPVSGFRPAMQHQPLATGLAADANLAFRSLAQQSRDDVADVLHLAQYFDKLLRAVEQDEIIHLPAAPQSAGLPPERRRALASQIDKLITLGQFLFGPDALHRRYDILWALATLKDVIGKVTVTPISK